MSAEGKKLLWISISAVVFVLLVLAAGFWLLSPKKGGAQAPAAISNSAPPKAQDPQDFLSAPPQAPSIEQPRNQDGGVIIVYGDKPTLPAAGTAAAAASGQASSSAPAAGTAAGSTASGSASTASAAGATVASSKPAVSAAAKSTAPAVSTSGAAKPKPKTTVSAAKAPPAKAAKIDEYWIQAASFTSRGRADDLKQALADKGIAALISVKDIASKSWYRVRIGPYSSKGEADGWMGRLKDVPGCDQAWVSKLTSTKVKQ